MLVIVIPTEISIDEPLNLKIVDLLGKEVLNQQINSYQTTLSINNLSIGLYTAVIYQSKTPIFTQKIIKQ